MLFDRLKKKPSQPFCAADKRAELEAFIARRLNSGASDSPRFSFSDREPDRYSATGVSALLSRSRGKNPAEVLAQLKEYRNRTFVEEIQFMIRSKGYRDAKVYNAAGIDLMGNLATQFDYVPAIMWMADFAESLKHDFRQAAFWYKKAADLGDGNGSRCYADMLMTGSGVKRNAQQAMRYYADAADKGVPEAAFVLGEFYRSAGGSENAFKAYQKAYNNGYAPAKKRIEQMNR